MKRTKGLVRVFAVLAVITTMLVPAATASALAIYSCDGEIYDATNPNHVLYGDDMTTLNPASGRMVVDAKTADGPRVFFWDGSFKTFEWHVSVPGIGTMVEIITTNGVEILGSRYDDLICGTDGQDVLKGRAGNDLILSFGNGNSPDGPDSDYNIVNGRGGDRLIGGKGHDTLVNGSSWLGGNYPEPSGYSAEMRGGKGDDTIAGGDYGSFPYVDFGNGGAGSDTFWAFADDVWFYGKAGDDTLTVAPYWFGDDTNCLDGVNFFGNNGNDTINLDCARGSYAWGGKGDDTIKGGNLSSDDYFFTGQGEWQWMFGGQGNDTISGGSGCSARLVGGPGDDVLNAGRGCDAGDDGWGPFWDFDQPEDAEYPLPNTFSPFYVASGSGWPGASASTFNDAAHAYGDAGNDTLNADQWPYGDRYGTVFLFGGDGDDSFNGGYGRDFMYGQAGNDSFKAPQADDKSDLMWGYTGDDTYMSTCEQIAFDDPDTEGYDFAIEHWTDPASFGGNDTVAGGFAERNLVTYEYSSGGTDWTYYQWTYFETRAPFCTTDDEA